MFPFFSSLLASVLLMIGTAPSTAQDNGPFDSPPSSATQDSDPFGSPLSQNPFVESDQNSLEEQVMAHLPEDLFVQVRALILEFERLHDEEKTNHEAITDFSLWMAQALEAAENPDLQKWALARLRTKPSLGKHPRLQAALIRLTEQPSTPLAKLATEILSQFHSDFRDVAPRPATNDARWPIYSASGGSREQEILEKIDEHFTFDRFSALESIKETIVSDYKIPCVLDFDVTKTDFFETVDLRSEQVMSLRAVLDHTLPKFGLTFQIRDEVLVITTVEKAANNPIRRVYRIAPESDLATAGILAEKLLAAFPERNLQVIANDDRILVIGSEQQHFEVSKLLTLLLEKD